MSIFQIFQTIVGIGFIGVAIFAPKFEQKFPVLRRHKVDRILIFFGGVLLTLYGIFGQLPKFW